MIRSNLILTAGLSALFALPLKAQQIGDMPQDSTQRLFTIDTPVNLDYQHDEDPIVRKKTKKRKRKVFYGIKTKKGFTRKGFGSRTVYETFYYMKKPALPNMFVRDIYYYDFTRHEIRKTNNYDPKKGALLNGPYEKRLGDVVLEKGLYYKGTKNGRWMTYDKDSILVDKEKYYKGWPRESMVAYYDPTLRTELKEIIPIEYGEKEGYYYMFFPNGKIAVTGEYHWDHKVGDWTEFYPDGSRKKVITYPDDPYDTADDPFIKMEWNAKGREIYNSLRHQ